MKCPGRKKHQRKGREGKTADKKGCCRNSLGRKMWKTEWKIPIGVIKAEI
jgi:hypothetical protein